MSQAAPVKHAETSPIIDTGVQLPVSAPDQRSLDQVSHTRHDVLRNMWTIFATGRQERPDDFDEAGVTKKQNLNCAFCSGNETQTPSPIWTGKVVAQDGRSDPNGYESKTR